ncbi:MAG: hypothetical protein AB7P12_05365, partial [Alphaproteobacteria bacterium]
MRNSPPPTGVHSPKPFAYPAIRPTATRGVRPLLAAALIAAFALAGVATNAASLKEGHQYYAAEEYYKALEEIEPLAEDGEAQAQYMLGIMHLKGQAVYPD